LVTTLSARVRLLPVSTRIPPPSTFPFPIRAGLMAEDLMPAVPLGSGVPEPFSIVRRVRLAEASSVTVTTEPASPAPLTMVVGAESPAVAAMRPRRPPSMGSGQSGSGRNGQYGRSYQSGHMGQHARAMWAAPTVFAPPHRVSPPCD